MLVKILEEVPDNLFYGAMQEIDSVNWATVIDPSAGIRASLPGARSIHIRKINVGNGAWPKTITEWAKTCECDDNPAFLNQFYAVRQLVSWINQRVNGTIVGRVMITNLTAGSTIPPHVDPLNYFDMFSRFHVPFRTHTNVTFGGGKGTPKEHMPFKWLSRLNTKLRHGVENHSQVDRIHLIADVATPEGNIPF